MAGMCRKGQYKHRGVSAANTAGTRDVLWLACAAKGQYNTGAYPLPILPVPEMSLWLACAAKVNITQGRIRCQYCRYQRCLMAGMCRKGQYNTGAYPLLILPVPAMSYGRNVPQRSVQYRGVSTANTAGTSDVLRRACAAKVSIIQGRIRC